MFRKVRSETHHTLSNYMFHEDVIALLKRAYFGSDKSEVAADNGAMETLVGSASEGRRILEGTPDKEWDEY